MRNEQSTASAARGLKAMFGASEVAILIGVHPNTVHRWAAGAPVSARHRSAFEDLVTIGHLFAEGGRPATARTWLHAMNPTLRDETPAEEIRAGRWVLAISAARDYCRAE